MSINYTTINENNQLIKELRKLKQWVIWGDKKLPFNPAGGMAKVNDSHTWGTYEEACRAVAESNGNYKGIAFVLTDNDPYTFIDLDDPDKFVVGGGDSGVNGDEIRKIHKDILSKFDSYIEISPSGRGYHIIVKGVVTNKDGVIGGRKSTKYKLEMYSAKHYMTVTGNAINDGVPVRECQEQLNDVYLQIFGESNDVNGVAANNRNLSGLNGSERHLIGSHNPFLRGSAGVGAGVAGSVGDGKIIRQALRAANGEAFGALMDGEWKGKYPSQSEADSVFLNMLKIYTRNPVQLARIFLGSGLGEREKAGKVVGDVKVPSDYLIRTINFVLDDGVGDGTYGVDISKFVEKIQVIDNDSGTGVQAKGFLGCPEIDDDMQPLTFPPGTAGDLARYIYESTRIPVTSFSIASALAIIAYINSNHCYVSGDDTALNLYQCIVGESGAGKDGCKKIIKKIIQAINNQRAMPGNETYDDITSGAALLRGLPSRKNVLMMMDEFGFHLENTMQEKGSVHKKELIGTLMELSGSGRSSWGGKKHASVKDNIPAVDKPYINMFGMSTPDELMIKDKERLISNGFFNRIIFVDEEGSGHERRNVNIKMDMGLLNKLISIRGVTPVWNVGNMGEYDGTALAWEPDAHEFINALMEKKSRIRMSNWRYRSFWMRMVEHTLRVSGVLAAADGEVIRLEHVIWSWKYVQRSFVRFTERLETGKKALAGSFQDNVDKALHIIKTASTYKDSNYTELTRKGIMPRSKLLKLLKLTPTQVNDVINHLIATDQIKIIDSEKKPCYTLS